MVLILLLISEHKEWYIVVQIQLHCLAAAVSISELSGMKRKLTRCSYVRGVHCNQSNGG